MVRQIWQEVLRLDDIGPDEDLFDLGGRSLTITAIAARIRKRLGVEVPLDAFFDTPTLAEISALVGESPPTGGRDGTDDPGSTGRRAAMSDDDGIRRWSSATRSSTRCGPPGRILRPVGEAEGFTGSEEECMAHVDRVWEDIRPLSLRRRLAEQGR